MHTVICAFDERADAERAMDSLVADGFSREMMHLQVGYDAMTADSAAATPPASLVPAVSASGEAPSEASAPGVLRRIADFFGELFGRDEVSGEPGFYAEVIRRGGTVLVVDAVGEAEAGRARTLMDRLGGTVDIDERAAQWRRRGWSGFDAHAPRVGEPLEPPEPADRAPAADRAPPAEQPAPGAGRAGRSDARIVPHRRDSSLREMLRRRGIGADAVAPQPARVPREHPPRH